MLSGLKKLVGVSATADEDYGHIKTLASGTLTKHLLPLSQRLTDEEEEYLHASALGGNESGSTKSITSTSSSVSPPTAVSLKEHELALIAASANILMRSRVNGQALYQGAMLAEWYYLNTMAVADNQKKPSMFAKAVHTGVNSTNTHAKVVDPTKDGKTPLARIVNALQTHAGVKLLEFNAELGRAHLDLFRRQGLLSEPYHVRRAAILLKDCFQKQEEQRKKAASGGWLGGFGTNGGTKTEKHIAVQALMYWEMYGTKAPDVQPSGNNSVASAGAHSGSGTGSQFTVNKTRIPKKLRYSAREKARKLLMADIANMYCSSLQHCGDIAEAIPVAKHMLSEAQLNVSYVQQAIDDAQVEMDIAVESIKAQAATAVAGGKVGGLDVAYESISGNNSVMSGSTASRAEKEKIKEKKKESKKDTEKELLVDYLKPARAEVLLKKQKLQAHRMLLLASLHLGVTAFEEAKNLILPLNPKKCPALEKIIPPMPVLSGSKPGSAHGSRPGSSQGIKPVAEAEEQEVPDAPLPEGMTPFDIMFITGRMMELYVESQLSLESPMDGYFCAYATEEEERKEREYKIAQKEMAEKRRWDKARMARRTVQGENDDGHNLAYSEIQESSSDPASSPNSPTKAENALPTSDADKKDKKSAPMLDMKEVIAERLKIKEELFRRRKELRKMRRAGITMTVDLDDPVMKQREQRIKKLRGDVKKWLGAYQVWSVVADKCMLLGMPVLAADLYRQGILRDNAGYAMPKLWFRWAKACHLSGRAYDTKLAVDQVQHFEPGNQQVHLIRKHMNIIGTGTSSRHGTNMETRNTFETQIRSQHHIIEILQKIVSPSSLYMYQFFAAAKLTGFIRKIAKMRKEAREKAELERLQNIWKHKPAAEPEILWDTPLDVYYPCFLNRGVQLNARAPLPYNSDDDYETESDDEVEIEEKGDSEASGSDEEGDGEVKKKKKRKKKKGVDDAASYGTLESSESLAKLQGEGDMYPAGEIRGTWVYTPDDRADPLPAGTHDLKVTFYPEDKEAYTHAIAIVTIKVLMNADPVELIWPEPEPRYIGCVLEKDTELNAMVRIGGVDYSFEDIYAQNMGRIEYRPKLNVKLPVGTHVLKCVYTPHDQHNYGGATKNVKFTVLPFLSVVKWDLPANIYYPQRLRLGQELNAYCVEQGGTFVYTPSIHANPLSVGSHQLMCEFWPYDDEHYGLVTQYTTLVVERRTPTIIWEAPHHIYVGEPVTYEQHMNAWVSYEKRNDVAPLTGCFRYSMDEYMRLAPGHHVIKCLFFPDDTLNYTCAESEVTITIRCVPAVIWDNFPLLRYGNPIEKFHQMASCDDCTGTFAYTPELGVVPISGGEQNFSVLFTPNDPTVYDTVEHILPVNIVNKLQPEILWEPLPVFYGTEINFSNGLNATCDQKGRWVYEGSGILIDRDEKGMRQGDQTQVFRPCGSYIVQANFFPTDTYNYELVSRVGTIVVQPTQIKLTYGPFADLTYGDATTPDHFYCEVSEPPRALLPTPTAHYLDSDFGHFTYSHTAGVILKAGTHDFKVTYTPVDQLNYVAAEITVHVKVLRHKPVVNWKKPSSIQYSDLITEKQLNAWVSDNVRDLPEEQQKIVGTITYTPVLGFRFATVGRHPITCTFVPLDGFNYSTVHIDFEISVRRYPVKITWERPEEIFEGQKLTDEQLNAKHDFPDLTPEDGKLVYDPPLNKKLEAGEHNLLCKFIPNPKVKDNFDLRSSYAEVTIFIAPTRSGMKSRGK